MPASLIILLPPPVSGALGVIGLSGRVSQMEVINVKTDGRERTTGGRERPAETRERPGNTAKSKNKKVKTVEREKDSMDSC